MATLNLQARQVYGSMGVVAAVMPRRCAWCFVESATRFETAIPRGFILVLNYLADLQI
ncbi:MAG: hypothetical protein AAF699_20870 [Pseudomonadota bacterium]